MVTNIPLTDKQLIAIGRIAVGSSYLESLVDFLISELSGLKSEQRLAMFPNAMMGGKIAGLKVIGLAKLRSKKSKARFTEIMEKIAHLNSQRVIAIHGDWQSLEKVKLSDFLKLPLTLKLGNAKATLKKASKESTLHADKLIEIADQIFFWHDELFQFAFSTWIRPKFRRSK